MKDEKLTTLLRQWLEVSPPDGLWKLNSPEMESLATYLADLIRAAYDRGWSEGYDSCIETLHEEANKLFGATI